LALLLGLRTRRVFRPVRSGEGEGAEVVAEERILDLTIGKTTVDTEDGAGVIRKAGAAGEVKEKVEAVAEVMLQGKAKHL
jgi:hypothetical protein